MKKLPLNRLKRVFQEKVYELNGKILKGHVESFKSEDLMSNDLVAH